MAQGNRVRQLCHEFPGTFERIKSQCQKFINIEVRFYMAEWLETNLMNCTNPDYFYVNFLEELKRVLIETTDLCLQNRFNDTLISVESHYGFVRSALYNDLHSYLLSEKELCDQLESGNTQPNEINLIYKEIHEIMKVCRKNEHDVRILGNLYENMRLNIDDRNHINAQFNDLMQSTNDPSVYQQMRDAELNRVQSFFTETGTNIEVLEQSIVASIQGLLQKVGKIHTIVIKNHLETWKISQLKFLNEGDPISKLDNIQMWFEGLIEILVSTRNQLNCVNNFHNELSQQNGMINCLEDMRKHCQSFLDILITKSLVYEKQPERIIKVETRFQPKVRLLIGKSINARMSDIKVELQLVSAESAQEILRTGVIPGELITGTLKNNQRSLVFSEQTNVCAAEFKQLIIKSRPKAIRGKIDAEGIVERPTALLVRVSINYGGTLYDLFQLSSPIVVIVHNNQDQIAWATAIWDSMFCSPNDPFTKVEQGSWHILAEAINLKFSKDTGRGLTKENLEFLYWKLTSSDLRSDSDPIVTWTQFAKEKLCPIPTMQEKDCFTFWQWVYSNLKLIIHNLGGMWQKGFIEGFVHKAHVHAKLSLSTNGTFILRFSDSMLGGISVAFVENGKVQHIAPNTRKELDARDLRERLRALEELKFFYPNIPKANVCEFPQIQATRKLWGDYIFPISADMLPTSLNAPSHDEDLLNNEILNEFLSSGNIASEIDCPSEFFDVSPKLEFR